MNDYAQLLSDTAFAAYRAGQHADAERLLKQLVGTGWRDAYATYFIGHLEYLQGNIAVAADYLSAAVAMDPNHARSHNDLGEALRVLGRHEEAIACYLRAIELQPDLAYPYGNLGAALHALNRDDEAINWIEQSIALSDNKAIAHCDLGTTLAWLNRHDEAIAQYRLAQSLQPDNPRARYSEALSLLTLGDFGPGWELHESRLADPTTANGRRASHEPAWRGEDIAGRTILLHAEQGLGDDIQFVRYVPLVAARGATVLLQVHRGLKSLLRNVSGANIVLESNEALPQFDLQCSLMSLPLAFRTELHSIPASVPYLTAEPQRVAAWRGRLGPRQRMRIGIVWSGNPSHANDRNRSIPLDLLAGLLSRQDIDFHMLQIEVRDSDRAALARLPQIQNHVAALHEMADTAALTSLMDLVITVDTAAAHLAGALGVPTWVMLPWAADWRWMLDRCDTPWYPTMRLFRQVKRGDWGDVLADVAMTLDRWSL
jgi:tetratricopeptide (TPR) repeat protein